MKLRKISAKRKRKKKRKRTKKKERERKTHYRAGVADISHFRHLPDRTGCEPSQLGLASLVRNPKTEVYATTKTRYNECVHVIFFSLAQATQVEEKFIR